MWTASEFFILHLCKLLSTEWINFVQICINLFLNIFALSRCSEPCTAGFDTPQRGSQLRCRVWSNILQIQWLGAISCVVHGRRALPPSYRTRFIALAGFLIYFLFWLQLSWCCGLSNLTSAVQKFMFSILCTMNLLCQLCYIYLMKLAFLGYEVLYYFCTLYTRIRE